MRTIIITTLTGLSLSIGLGAQEPDPKLAPFLVPEKVKRVALVLGAERYEHFAPVPNALNDASQIANALSGLEFSTVRHIGNPLRTQIEDAASEIAELVGSNPAIVLFFFAGHGFRDREGENYIVPVNATSDDTVLSSVPVARILGTIVSDRPGMTILLLDACRTTVSAAAETSNTARIGQEGFAQVGQTENAVLGFASSFGSPATSKATPDATNSPYTTALLKNLSASTPDQDLDKVLDAVRNEVRRLTNRSQTPTVLKGAASSAFSFRPSSEHLENEREEWKRVLRSYEDQCVRSYMDAHPDSPYLWAALRWRSAPPQAGPGGGQPCPYN